MTAPSELMRARLLGGASVLLVTPLIDAQDPNGTTEPARVLRRIQRSVWQEVAAPTSSADPWRDLLVQLASAFEDYVDTSPDGEDFLGMAADQVGSSLELLSAPVQEQERAWVVLRSIFDALDRQGRAERKAVFFGPWLSALHAELTALAGHGIGASAAIHQRVEHAVAEIAPMVVSGYAANKDASDWDYEI